MNSLSKQIDREIALELGCPDEMVTTNFDIANWLRIHKDIRIWVEHGTRNKKDITNDIVIGGRLSLQFRRIEDYDEAWQKAVSASLHFLKIIY